MTVYIDGWDRYQIHDLTREDLEGIVQMISSSQLPVKRGFNSLKEKIDKVLKI